VRGFSRNESGSWRHDVDRTPNIAYIRISAFLENTTRDFEDALRSVHRSGAKALVLDLRFNPGGLMTEAVQVVDRFLHSGLIVATVSRRKAEQEYFATEDDFNTELELAVLINGASASASEIVAGALQDHGRAMVIGERSFGKGSVQRLIHLVESGGAVKLTTAYYRLPKGRFIHRNATDDASDAWGIVPDIEVSLSPEIAERIQTSRRELDLRTPLTQPCRTAPRNDLPEVGKPCLFIDPQLAAAIAALRSRVSSYELDTAWITDDSTP
jgi:carboxyl-terminal processing protease